jgi:hypothetical protein
LRCHIKARRRRPVLSHSRGAAADRERTGSGLAMPHSPPPAHGAHAQPARRPRDPSSPDNQPAAAARLTLPAQSCHALAGDVALQDLTPSLGNGARDAIAARFPGAAIEQGIRTGLGWRVIDVLTTGGAAIESKLGRTSLTRSVQRQLAKDQWLLANERRVTSVEWQFSRSSATGQIGPTQPLIDALNNAGIRWSLVP